MTSPSGYDPNRYPPFAVTADIVVLTTVDGDLSVVLIRRGSDPYLGQWALPGGFVEPDEDLADAAARELAEETGLDIEPYRLTQLGAYGDPGRDPRMRVVSVVFRAFIPELPAPRPGSDAAETRLVPVGEAMKGSIALAFDHRTILEDAIEALDS